MLASSSSLSLQRYAPDQSVSALLGNPLYIGAPPGLMDTRLHASGGLFLTAVLDHMHSTSHWHACLDEICGCADLPAISIWMLRKCFKDLGTRTNFRHRWKSCNVGSSARFPPKLSANKGKTRGVFELTCSISIFFDKRQIWSSVSSSIAFHVATVFPSLTNCCNWQKSTTFMAFFQGNETM